MRNLYESYKNAPDDEELKAIFEEHEREKILSCQAKDCVNEIIVSMLDLQDVMPCTTGEVSVFYYKSKINCYNFSVCRLGSDVEYYFWIECEGTRGANEIGTGLWMYLQKTSLLVDDENLNDL